MALVVGEQLLKIDETKYRPCLGRTLIANDMESMADGLEPETSQAIS